jgi:hypothetical protein
MDFNDQAWANNYYYQSRGFVFWVFIQLLKKKEKNSGRISQFLGDELVPIGTEMFGFVYLTRTTRESPSLPHGRTMGAVSRIEGKLLSAA